jgi:NitT/TauT family transport system substrate-binding protein
MRKMFLTMLLLLLTLVSGACHKPTTPLRVGANIWPGYEPLYLARSLGYYDGRLIKLITFPSTSDVIRAYRSGAINVAAVTLDEALQIAETLPEQRIVLICDFSQGADVILAQPQFSTMQQLRGRRIGVEQTALGAYMLARALEISGMKPQEVKVVPLPLEEHEAAYNAGLVDAVVTFEPRRSRLLAAGAHPVFDSRQLPGEIVDVLLIHPELISTAGDTLRTLIDGWFRALTYLQEQPQDAARRIAPRQHLTAAQFLLSLQGLALPDRSTNVIWLGRSAHNLDETLKRLKETMITNKLLSPAPPARLSFDDHFVRKGKP